MITDWYPGHMKKARTQIRELLPRIDLVVELLDARLPASSSNPVLSRLRQNKPCLKLLNKQDLADPQVTRAWVSAFEGEQTVRALGVEATSRRDAGLIAKICRGMLQDRARANKPLRLLVVGIPNVGKSTLINTLAGKKIARTGDKPAITTCPQQIDLRNGILLADTPGLLWPVLDDLAGACRLAASGALGDSAYDSPAVALTTAAFLLDSYPESLQRRYQLEQLPSDPEDLLNTIGRRRGCLIRGGEVDQQRAADVLLRDLRGGQLGRISLERPGEQASAFSDYAAAGGE